MRACVALLVAAMTMSACAPGSSLAPRAGAEAGAGVEAEAGAGAGADAGAGAEAGVDAGAGAGADAGAAKLALKQVSECVPPSMPAAGTWNEALDVEWGTPYAQSMKLDVAWPKDKGPHPLVVLIHGGGWTAGKKDLFRDVIRLLAGQGFVAATVGYRLASKAKNVFPAAIEDVRCSLRYLRLHASDYGLDPTKVVAIGASAGGHLAAMLATASDHIGFDAPCPYKTQPVTVSGAIAYYAPLELRGAASRYVPKMQQAVAEFLGDPSESIPDKAALASPITHVDAKDAPVLTIHGTADPIVPIDDSRRFDKALASAGVPHLLVEIDGGKHGFPVLGKGTSIRPATCTAMAFLRAVTGK